MTTSTDSQGRFSSNVGTMMFDPDANSISGRVLTIEGATLSGTFADGDRFCASLGGTVTVPFTYVLVPAQNTCLFIKLSEGSPLPDVPKEDFVCPP